MRKSLLFVCCLMGSLCLYAQTSFWGVTSGGGKYNAGVLFKTDASGDNYTVKHEMVRYDGDYPLASLVQASDGKLYGMTSSCCVFDANGVLFQYDPVTSTYSKKFDFNDSINGNKPYGSLIQATNGKLYGLTSRGGLNGTGVLFEFDPATSTYTKKLDFDNTSRGSTPLGTLMEAKNGKLYGMTSSGGANDFGVLFEFDPATSTYSKKFDFNGTLNGSNPQGALIQTADGKLYGLTSSGGTNDFGVLFQYDPANSTYSKKLDFNGPADGSYPYGSLLLANDGSLYGLTTSGGTNDFGVLFEFDPATSTYSKKFDFDDVLTGSAPQGSLMQSSDGKLYGMTQSGGTNGNGVIFYYDIMNSTFSKRFDFESIETGKSPAGSLIQALDGKLYGMTYDGGANGVGTLFQFDPASAVYNKKFDFHYAENGSYPLGNLMLASDKMIYGTTSYGGKKGDGVLYQYNPETFAYTKKLDFADSVSGAQPTGSLLQAADGKLYGMTTYGGDHDMGIIFQYDPVTSVFSKKHAFNGALTGSRPYGALIQATDGMLYGMTREGGTNDFGTVFQYNPVTGKLTKKFDFDGAMHGKYPGGSLLQALDGMLYGTTSGGGSKGAPQDPGGFGVLFQFNPVTGSFTKKFDFDGTHGKYPEGSLIQAPDGKLYGLASRGGKDTSAYLGFGVLFQYDPVNATCTGQFDFNGLEHGAAPNGSLLLASDGKLYGTTLEGGKNNVGVLFQYDLATSAYKKKFDFDNKNGKHPDQTNLLEVKGTTSITQVKQAAGRLKVYPNPSNGQVYLLSNQKMTNATIKIFTLTGQLVLEKTDLSGNNIQVDISQQPRGVYFLQVAEHGDISRIKLVKE